MRDVKHSDNLSSKMVYKASLKAEDVNSTNFDGEWVDVDDGEDMAQRTLNYEQVLRLAEVVDSRLSVPGRGNYPVLKMTVRELILAVRQRLESDNVHVLDVRINGGAASHIVMGDEGGEQDYNDLDLIFRLDQLSVPYDLDIIKDSAVMALQQFLPAEVIRDRLGPTALAEGYLQKMVKIDGNRSSQCGQTTDRWNLLSLDNEHGRSLEMKFVVSMRRQYEFSIDSFQVVVDGLLHFQSISPANLHTGNCFYPTVVAVSAYGDFAAAYDHASKKLIATRNPAEIRGGGLLKYCGLLARGYRPASDFEAPKMERYMCSRFFIDFPDVEWQRNQLDSYLLNHFNASTPRLRHTWLLKVREVISRGAQCLESHRRKQTVTAIERFIAFDEHRCRRYHWPNGNNCRLSPLGRWSPVDQLPAVQTSEGSISSESRSVTPDRVGPEGAEDPADIIQELGTITGTNSELDADSAKRPESVGCISSDTHSNKSASPINELQPVPAAQLVYTPCYYGVYPYPIPATRFCVPYFVPVIYTSQMPVPSYVQRC